MEPLSLATITPLQIVTAGITAVLLGLSRMGLTSVTMFSVPILAMAFGGRISVGLVLPLALSADIAGVITHYPDLRWRPLFRVLPAAVVGIALGTWLGASIPDDVFKRLMGVVLLVGLAIQGYRDVRGVLPQGPVSLPWTLAIGILGGFTSMVGNAAGAVMMIYFFAAGLAKNTYVAVWVWFFFLVNLIKLYPHIVIWKSITPDSLLVGLAMIPGLILGLLIGRRIVAKLPEKPFRRVMYFGTMAATLALFF